MLEINGKKFGPFPLTVPQTWLVMAELWKSPMVYDDIHYGDICGVVVPGCPDVYSDSFPADRGLCDTVQTLYDNKMITSETYYVINQAIEAAQVALNKDNTPCWLFPKCEKGAQERHEFCMHHYMKSEGLDQKG